MAHLKNHFNPRDICVYILNGRPDGLLRKNVTRPKVCPIEASTFLRVELGRPRRKSCQCIR